ncbi:MAG: hypothetical protein ACLPYZ_07110 [Limisphaerales bacterium]
MIMVFYGLTEGRQNKNAAGVWRPAAIGLFKILSQPQVRAYRPKPIKEILAAGCVVHLLAVHKAKVAEPDVPSSITVAPFGNVGAEVTRLTSNAEGRMKNDEAIPGPFHVR